MIGKTKSITVLSHTEGTNDLGEVTQSWSEKAVVEGVIWQLSGKEQYESDKDTRIIKHRMACDITVEITENDRIEFQGTEFDIERINDVNNLGNRYQLDLKEVR